MNQFLLLCITTIVSFVLSACGYYKFVYFFSLGYGFSISGIGITLLYLFRHSLTLWNVLLCSLLILYGIRLSGYLAIREIKSAQYRNILKNESKQDVPFNVKTYIWIAVVILYVCMTSPVSFRMYNQTPDNLMIVIGTLIAYTGFAIEFTADQQKSAVKKKDPKMFASEGLYKFVRCPNYFGELTIWFGVLLSGFSALNNVLQWTLAILGYIGIVFVMFSGARRLELRQDRVYAENEKYKEYIKKTPIIIPGIPLYSVKKYKWLVA